MKTKPKAKSRAIVVNLVIVRTIVLRERDRLKARIPVFVGNKASDAERGGCVVFATDFHGLTRNQAESVLVRGRKTLRSSALTQTGTAADRRLRLGGCNNDRCPRAD